MLPMNIQMMIDETDTLFERTKLERPLWERGKSVAGMDEAGRGPLAGPVAAACVIMPPEPLIHDVNDSKQISEKKRQRLCKMITNAALDKSVSFVDVDYINENGIQAATLTAFKRAYDGMTKKPDCVLSDYITGLSLPVEPRVIKKGDTLSYSIAAASILAKTARDEYMMRAHERYPQYGFDKHKGYGTALHVAAIDMFGPCPIHRTQFIQTALLGKQDAYRRMTNKDWGFLGERRAEEYLKSLGYTTLERNYRAERAEIDLIMRDNDTTVFVEVKLRSTDKFGSGAEAVTLAKQRSIIRCSLSYIAANSLMDTSLRFDVVEIGDPSTEANIRHIIAAFTA